MLTSPSIEVGAGREIVYVLLQTIVHTKAERVLVAGDAVAGARVVRMEAVAVHLIRVLVQFVPLVEIIANLLLGQRVCNLLHRFLADAAPLIEQRSVVARRVALAEGVGRRSVRVLQAAILRVLLGLQRADRWQAARANDGLHAGRRLQLFG